MSSLGSLLRGPNWRNLEEAGRLITVRGNGVGSLEYLKINWRKARNKLVLKEPYLGEPVYNDCQVCQMRTSMRFWESL